jgi:hypothetical protein
MAWKATDRLLGFVTQHPHLSLIDLLVEGGRALAPTRGAAATFARLTPERIEVAGVGNVRVHARAERSFSPLPAPGILGATHAAPREFACRVTAGDTFFIYTDGIGHEPNLPQGIASLSLQEVAEAVLLASKERLDDATVVAVRATL